MLGTAVIVKRLHGSRFILKTGVHTGPDTLEVNTCAPTELSITPTKLSTLNPISTWTIWGAGHEAVKELQGRFGGVGFRV